jgi:DNA-binding PadR family transcriptional regulator
LRAIDAERRQKEADERALQELMESGSEEIRRHLAEVRAKKSNLDEALADSDTRR